jgi:hypothetical protein
MDLNGDTVNPGKEGSRASAKEKWFAKIWWLQTNNGIQDKPGKRNVVTPGNHDPVNNP